LPGEPTKLSAIDIDARRTAKIRRHRSDERRCARAARSVFNFVRRSIPGGTARDRAALVPLGPSDTASPKVWMDAYFAAFAIAAGLKFISFDSDFKQFELKGLDLQLLKSL
jgi:predicted nucleic acid-binding protein